MNMVFHAADLDRRTVELFGNATEIGVQRIPRSFVAQQRATVFGGKDEMNINGGKGLWHGEKMANFVIIFQSQRDCGLQPKVGTPAYLGFTFPNGNNLNEVVAVGARIK